MSLPAKLAAARLIVCVGPGGVGKTTLAAALGVALARREKSVFVLTIDPAKRLAEALGLSGLSDQAAVVPLDAGGSLSAAMLDTKASYDALLSRLSPSPHDFQALLDNAVYRAFSRTLARSHAYVAMERTLAEVESGVHDVVVLDTPPLRSALDILDAPGRLAGFLDSGAARALVGSGAVSSRAARGLLSVLTGRRLAGELAGFLGALLPLERGFRERAERTRALLRSPATAFVLVTAPRATTLSDASYLASGLGERGLSPALCIVNRAFVGEASDPLVPVAPRAESPELVARLRHEVAAGNRAAARLTADFLGGSLPAPAVAMLPELAADVAELAALGQLADLLTAGRSVQIA